MVCLQGHIEHKTVCLHDTNCLCDLKETIEWCVYNHDGGDNEMVGLYGHTEYKRTELGTP